MMAADDSQFKITTLVLLFVLFLHGMEMMTYREAVVSLLFIIAAVLSSLSYHIKTR